MYQLTPSAFTGDQETDYLNIGTAFTLDVLRSRHMLSGEWLANGASPSGIAQSFKGYFSPALEKKLLDATSVADKGVEMAGPIVALPAGGGDDLTTVASPQCIVQEAPFCQFVTESGETPGGIQPGSIKYPSENRVTFTLFGYSPAAIASTGKGAAVETVLNVDLSFVPSAGGSKTAPYLIDKVNTKIESTHAMPLDLESGWTFWTPDATAPAPKDPS